MFFSHHNLRRLGVVAVIAVLALTAFGFAAANTVPASKAGDGAGAISGYTVSNIEYTLDANNPANIDTVTFTLDAVASSVRAATNATSPTVACTNTAGNDWSCDLNTPANAATSLFVAAAQ